uniref:(northern house mosquito) hypothetical protein n=1 Tax=Culex pipiens TaxID=7175 RepID=A0A8D8G8F9_CULPI
MHRVFVLSQRFRTRQWHSVVFAQRIVLLASDDSPDVHARAQFEGGPLFAEARHLLEEFDVPAGKRLLLLLLIVDRVLVRMGSVHLHSSTVGVTVLVVVHLRLIVVVHFVRVVHLHLATVVADVRNGSEVDGILRIRHVPRLLRRQVLLVRTNLLLVPVVIHLPAILVVLVLKHPPPGQIRPVVPHVKVIVRLQPGPLQGVHVTRHRSQTGQRQLTVPDQRLVRGHPDGRFQL